ncbi:MAG: hypothetical protein ACT4QD_26610 [Acidobacteriota bacterium]
MVDLNTGEPRILVPGGGPPAHAASYVFYNRQDRLVAHRFDERASALVGEPIPVGDVVADQMQSVVFASDLVLSLVTSRFANSYSLVWVDRAGQRTPAPGGARPNFAATIAMHDDRVLTTSVVDATARRPDIWTIHLDSGAATRLFQSPATWDAHPRWSRDGRRVLFRVDDTLRVADVGSPSPPTTLVESIPGLERVDDWSRDVRHVLVSVATAERRFDILHVDLQSGAKPTPLVATAATESFARFSPDTALVAYVSDVTGPPEVYVQPFPGAGPSSRVSLSGGTLPKWSADGSRLYFFSPDGWIMEAPLSRAGGEITVGTPVRAAPGSGHDFAPASDGQRFLLAEEGARQSVVIVNWQSLLPRR